MFRIRMPIAAALTAAVVSTSTPPAAADAGQPGEMIRAVNFVRGWNQRRPLHLSARLSRGASAWARSLMRRNVLAHDSGALRRGEGEVIEWHTDGSPQINDTVLEWLGSPPHRRVMLGRGLREAGAGEAVGYFGGQLCTIWVARFAG